MVLSLNVTNYKSIVEKQHFSMLVNKRIKELPSNAVRLKKEHVLKSVIIYGANGSGKSNMIQAFNAIKRLVIDSGSYKLGDTINYGIGHILDLKYFNDPVEIEIEFIANDGLKYKYAIIFTHDKIISEELFYYPGKNPALLFFRDENAKIKIGTTIKQDLSRIQDSLYENQLFLSKIGSDKVESLIPAYSFFYYGLKVHSIHDTAFDDALIQAFSSIIDEKHSTNLKHNITQLMKVADIGIRDILFKKGEDENISPKSNQNNLKGKASEEERYDVNMIHKFYNNGEEDGTIEFNLGMESTGTNKLLAVGLFILGALESGSSVVVDELDKSLHPYLTKVLIQLFNSSRTNPKNAQLIFASHDVSLLSNKLFRRDQVYFAEKSIKGASQYYSLGDIQGVRNNLSYEKYYMKGIFGGIPLINEYDLDFKFD